MKIKILHLLFVVCLFAGCERGNYSLSEEPDKNNPESQFSNQDVIRGRMKIKLSEEPPGEVSVRSIDGKTTTGIPYLDKVAGSLGIEKIRRIFPPAGRFEERSRREGLHLWYEVWFSEDMPSTRAVNDFSGIDGIEIAVPVYKVVSRSSSFEFDRWAPKNAVYPFNDPYFSAQWNLYNPGTENWQTKGADINIVDVWKEYNGHPDIIVAVVDGGIALDNPDLQANLWVNKGEISGNGRDDDDNGYIDDIHGYNFVTESGNITPIRHGTHVAGIIGAANNNGIGVSGIAGGDGTPNSGVKLMSCQIFVYNDGSITSERAAADPSIAAAIKYGADNGAVISQNSWGKPREESGVDPVYKAAIDYFIKYAGCDNDGNQLPESPMKGGIVLFAAANVSTSTPGTSAPADYEKVIGVASLGPDFTKSPLSAYGDFIDICAPGGINYTSSGGIYSTSIAELGYYEYITGTSMACPHVAGVAALIIQKYGVGKPGFTARQLEEILLATATSVDAYNPEYAGLLGAGCVDATRALTYDEPVLAKSLVLETNQITDGIIAFQVNNALAGDATITIRNGTGSIVLRKNIKTIRFTRTTLDIGKLAAGYYTFEYECNGEKVTEKIIKL